VFGRNISDIVNTAVNPKIKDLGLRVACIKPPYQILNKFGQPSFMNLWSFYRTSAANDSDFQPESLEDALRRDYSAIAADYMQCQQSGQCDAGEAGKVVGNVSGD
jgi:hypothetical protein